MNSLYNATYNPDVLSCIANLSNDEVFTPPSVANAMLDLLPQELFSNPDAKFLDPACKSGVFLREIAKRLIKGLEKKIPDLQKRLDHIFKNQLYGIAITEITSLLSRRSLYCSKYPNCNYSVTQFENAQGNIFFNSSRTQHRWVDGKCSFCGASRQDYGDDVRKGLEKHAYQFIHNAIPGEIKNMKFDVIIGNPPYQLGTQAEGQERDKPIYHKFVNQAKNLKPNYLIMIIPARWYVGNWSLDNFHDEMLNDHRISNVHDFPESKLCFPGVEIKGGVCYFLWEKNYNGPCLFSSHDENGVCSRIKRYLNYANSSICIRSNEAIPIIDKVRNKNYESFSKIVSSQNPFGFNTAFKGFDKRKSENDVEYYTRGKIIQYLNRSDIKKNEEWINQYKVFIPKAGEGGALPNKILGRPFFAGKGTTCSGTYMVIGPFSNKSQANNVISYINTNFFRFLISLRKITQDTNSDTYKFVPMQDFSKSWTDEELYKKYKLTKEEIAFIESMIRPME